MTKEATIVSSGYLWRAWTAHTTLVGLLNDIDTLEKMVTISSNKCEHALYNPAAELSSCYVETWRLALSGDLVHELLYK